MTLVNKANPKHIAMVIFLLKHQGQRGTPKQIDHTIKYIPYFETLERMATERGYKHV